MDNIKILIKNQVEYAANEQLGMALKDEMKEHITKSIFRAIQHGIKNNQWTFIEVFDWKEDQWNKIIYKTIMTEYIGLYHHLKNAMNTIRELNYEY